MKRLFAAAMTAAALLSAPQVDAAKSTIATAELREIGIEQKIGTDVPLDLVFRDEAGNERRLGSYFGKRPIVLTLIYNACPMLCNQTLQGMSAAMRVLEMNAGVDYDAMVVSFDPEESHELAAKIKSSMVSRYGRPGAEKGIHFLTGDEGPIRALTDAVGFRYQYDEKLGEYAHGSALIVLTPEGRVARYFYGTEFSPRDLRLSRVEATEGKLGSLADELLLLCYRYDPTTGTYSGAAMGAMRIGGAVTIAALAAFVGVSIRRERKKGKSAK